MTEIAKKDNFLAVRQSFSMKQHTMWRFRSMRTINYLDPMN